MTSLLGVIQEAISSPLWAFGIIIITLVWMGYERYFSPHPVEGPFNGWGYTVLTYTLITVWLEGFMKVQQSHQSRMQQQQMDRIEFILRFLGDQNRIIHSMLERNEERDKVMYHLIKVTNQLAEGLYDSVAVR